MSARFLRLVSFLSAHTVPLKTFPDAEMTALEARAAAEAEEAPSSRVDPRPAAPPRVRGSRVRGCIAILTQLTVYNGSQLFTYDIVQVLPR